MHLNDPIAPILEFTKYLKEPLYGIELEYENYKGIRAKRPLWACVKDGSLRNNGVEFVSVPLKYNQLDEALGTIAEIHEHNEKLQANERCGVHVHLNVRPYTWGNLWSLAVLYTLLEPSIFARFAPLRKNSHFCVPMFYNTAMPEIMLEDVTKLRNGQPFVVPPKQPTKTKKKIRLEDIAAYHGVPIEDMMEIEDLDQPRYQILRQQFEVGMRIIRAPQHLMPGGGGIGGGGIKAQLLQVLRSSKYCAMNFSRLAELGTVEFRQAPATKDMQEVHDWAQFLGNMQQQANKFADCLDVLNLYEDRGLKALLRLVHLKPQPIAEDEQRNAFIAATFMAGQIPPKWQDLEWPLKKGAA